MTDKRILIVDEETLIKIDENRGDMNRAEFIKCLIDNQLGETENATAIAPQYVDREEFQEFSQGMKDLLKRFLDFFISYGLELGQEPKDGTFSELVQKLQTLSASGGKPKSNK
jgi:NAD(P)H-flavin reductase